MQTIIFECKTITPMFMYGADGKTTPELRPASIKGVMRFWWRAICGNSNIQELKDIESKFFGSTKRRSKVNIRISDIQDNIKSYQELINEIKAFNGIKYNFYPIFMQNKGKFYFDTLTFDLIVSSYDNNTLEEAINSLIYLHFFGALGSRNRRGAGSIKLTVKENKDKLFENKLTLLDTSSIQTKEQFRKHIFNLINQIEPTSNTLYTTFFKNIYIFEPKRDWKSALEIVAKPFQKFRTENKSNVLETPNFGFPIRHRKGDTFIGGEIKQTYKNEKKEEKAINLVQRRGSPLFFKVFKANNNCYFPILIWMEGNLLPSYRQVIIKKPKNNKKIENRKPNEQIIQQFIDTFKDYAKVEKNGK